MQKVEEGKTGLSKAFPPPLKKKEMAQMNYRNLFAELSALLFKVAEINRNHFKVTKMSDTALFNANLCHIKWFNILFFNCFWLSSLVDGVSWYLWIWQWLVAMTFEMSEGMSSDSSWQLSKESYTCISCIVSEIHVHVCYLLSPRCCCFSQNIVVAGPSLQLIKKFPSRQPLWLNWLDNGLSPI